MKPVVTQRAAEQAFSSRRDSMLLE